MNLALTPDTRSHVDFGELIAQAGAVGFTALGCPAPRAAPETQRAYESAGLVCHELMALLITNDAARTVAYAERLAASAATMSAPWVNTVFVAPPTPDVAEVITRCAAILAEAGSAMAVEFSPAGPVPGIAEGLEIVALAGHGARLLVDTWHFAIGPSSWADLEALAAEQVAYVQFTDAAKPVSDDLMSETMDRRLLPGDGIADVRRFADVMRGNGFDGWVSVEVLSDELRSRPSPEVLTALFETAARYWR